VSADLRARFEALAKEHGYDFLKDSQGQYIARIAQFAWQAVQAMQGDDADQVLVSKTDLRDWQAQYTEENADGEHDCITPYDKYLY
jgi:hypothetical protein